MGDEGKQAGMLANTQDVHLLREIARWRRAAGITYWRSNGILGRFTQWSEIGRDGRQVSIDFTLGDDYEGNERWHADMTIGRKREFGGVKVKDGWTLEVAIDALVSFGYLPRRFSSAYRAGWEAALKAGGWEPIGHVQPSSEASPAVEPAW